MRSSGRCDALNLERGLPTTADDVAALRRVRGLVRLDLPAYLRFLGRLPRSPAEELRSRPGPRAAEPFVLRAG
jgi:hypothetical protein